MELSRESNVGKLCKKRELPEQKPGSWTVLRAKEPSGEMGAPG